MPRTPLAPPPAARSARVRAACAGSLRAGPPASIGTPCARSRTHAHTPGAVVAAVALAVALAGRADASAVVRKEFSDIVIGIDLGTTFSCAAVYRGGSVEIIPNDVGARVTPSYVAFTDHERLVGEAAKHQLARNPRNTVFDAKRLIGRPFDDPLVQADIASFPFRVVNRGNRPYIRASVNGRNMDLAPEEISAMVLTRLRENAEAYLGVGIDKAVVTVPAYFSDGQRQATKNAGKIAGLDVKRIINEPTAAAIAYGLDRTDRSQLILVFDLGGGTFDVSLLRIEQGVFEVVATNGDTHLGGEDFDQALVKHLVELFERKHRSVTLADHPRALQKLKRAAEQAKIALSSSHETYVDVDALADGIDMREKVTRAKFEELNMALFKKTLEPVEQVLRDGGILKRKVDEIVLVGGSTRIPKIRDLLREFFGKEPNHSVNPDEAVAYGAAVQAGILGGKGDAKTAGLVLLDVTPLTLGVGTVGGIMTPIIPRNTVIPTTKSKTLSTHVDNQRNAYLPVYQGERSMVKDNIKLGEFVLQPIPPAPKGVPKLEVTYHIDVNGILLVTAEDKLTGHSQSITIEDSNRLSDKDIERMVQNANRFAEEDERVRRTVLARNELEDYLYSIRTGLEDHGDKIGADGVAEITAVVDEVRDWLDTGSDAAEIDDIDEQRARVSRLWDPIITRLYEGGHDEL